MGGVIMPPRTLRPGYPKPYLTSVILANSSDNLLNLLPNVQLQLALSTPQIETRFESPRFHYLTIAVSDNLNGFAFNRFRGLKQPK